MNSDYCRSNEGCAFCWRDKDERRGREYDCWLRRDERAGGFCLVETTRTMPVGKRPVCLRLPQSDSLDLLRVSHYLVLGSNYPAPTSPSWRSSTGSLARSRAAMRTMPAKWVLVLASIVGVGGPLEDWRYR